MATAGARRGWPSLLTFPQSGTVLKFRSDGLLASDVDRNGNAITFAVQLHREVVAEQPAEVVGTDVQVLNRLPAALPSDESVSWRL